jgi:hypothetical protein
MNSKLLALPHRTKHFTRQNTPTIKKISAQHAHTKTLALPHKTKHLLQPSNNST